MDKSATKRFAVWARRELISRVAQKALQYGITDKEIISAEAGSIDGTVLSDTEKKQRKALVEQINKKDYEQVMEEVAYTWFNRFIALRYMEVNSYLPSKVRVFTDENNAFKPQIIDEAIHMELQGLDIEKVYALKEANKVDELYKYLLITQCNALNEVLPRMFPKIEDYTELLFPDNLLREGSVIHQMIALIPEEDWQDAVQIIGWLYQYYNTEKKDEVFAALKKNVKISKDNIPAATQLFTPDWIVRYMVENSLGRLWVEGHPDEEIKKNWKYYLEEAEQEPEVQTKLTEIRKEYANLKPEDIKCIDPCMGSGHILAYMFDVLVQIYEAYGYTTRDAVASIVENNIFGLDIDDRAAQLAYFAVMMKACQYDKRFLKRGIQPNVYAIRESNGINAYALEYFCNGDKKLTSDMNKLVSELRDAKEYGSILNVSMVDFDAIESRIREIEDDVNIAKYEVMFEIVPLIKVAKNLAQRYEIVVTNPPYMSANGMSGKLVDFTKEKYPDSKSDLFACFIEKCSKLSKNYYAMITQQSWMFLTSYEELRRKLLNHCTVNMAHLGAHAFDEIGGEIVQTTAFVNNIAKINEFLGTYIRLVDGNGEKEKEDLLFSKKRNYAAKQKDFAVIPGAPIAYWASDGIIDAFKTGTLMSNLATPKQGMSTCDVNRFVHYWFEVDVNNTNICDENNHDGWIKYNKGGEYRKWYGNLDTVVLWHKNGDLLKANKAALRNQDSYFKEFIAWTKIASTSTGFRDFDNNFLFDGAGGSLFVMKKNEKKYILGFLNTKICMNILNIVSPTVNFNESHIGTLPVVICDSYMDEVEKIVTENIELSRNDWDLFETSWDFKKHPLI